jgi:diguanylate cyclase (GGDEF)-like protein/PAS domain S-box-containing protein
VRRRDVLGELQQALERMRARLRQYTINKSYLHSVLNSMTDAVFVTSPDGVIKLANSAACKLLGFSEEEILGRGIVAVLDERERESFDLTQAAQETRETVVRTRAGQTIPVSLTGSHIESDDPQFQGNIFVARNITDRKRAERRIRYLARYDALTKIPNRMQFHHLLQQTIARALRSGQVVALLYLDMDRFKEVNDTFGHGSGDRVLEVLAERLTRSLPKDTIVGRLAGDEFALFVDGLPADSDNRGPIAHLARSILTEVSRAFQLNQHEVFLTASIGVALCPRDAENVIDLIRNADAAMYYSKQNGGNTFAFYSPEMNAAAVERLMLKSKLRRALERDELVIKYQPKVDLRSGRIIGAEALLRWRLPGHGDISAVAVHSARRGDEPHPRDRRVGVEPVCMDYRHMQSEGGDPGGSR